MEFLSNSELSRRPLNLNIRNLSPKCLFIGNGNQALEVAVFSSNSKPASGIIQQAFKDRRSGRACPILIVVNHPLGASMCGTGGDQPPVYNCNDVKQVERLCESALKLADRNAAINFLSEAMPSLETLLPGIANEGLFSSHELTHGTKNRPDWQRAVEFSRNVIGKADKDLITKLGFQTKTIDNLTDLLTVNEERTALAVLLKEKETPEISNERFSNMSPVSYALTKADKEKLPWVILVKGDRLRLYNTKNIGVGRRGRTETYIECQLSLMATKDIGLIWMLFSSDALKDKGTINSIIEESKRFAADVADKLRDRIYDIVVPELAMGIASAQNISNPDEKDINLTFEMALTILFRLLFIAYAEDRDLLPYKGNELYRKRSLKTKAIELAETASKNVPTSNGSHHWTETVHLWRAVSKGNKEWGVPAYDGTMFSNDPAVSKAGATIDMIELPNSCFELALRGLLLTDTKENQFSPVDFRALSVREFGTIYEGLLESELSVSEQDLTRDKNGSYLPAKDKNTVFIKAGEIYLHDKSGARKSSGSYYTPEFAVEHLLDGALETALDQHLENMKNLNEAEKVEQFFDFRVVDIAMGSGHFLVAAIDRIERRFALWLEENPSPGILRELQFLRQAAKDQMGELAETVIIEDGQLLRRMIARRCIYGVDLNPITVQLARLSIWIHTFVPGLPLSLLDHNLVQGNALIGIGSLDEIRKKFDESSGTLFAVDADNLLGQAAEPLKKLAKLSDSSVKDIESGRALIEEARLKTLETKALCDLIVAQPVSDDPRLLNFQFEDWERQKSNIHRSIELSLSRKILQPLSAFHFPIAFPEVFLGRSQGFNVVLGNPPWEEVKAEERDFWTGLFPGLRGLTQREQVQRWKEFSNKRPDLQKKWTLIEKSTKNLATILRKGDFPGLEVGDLDLYKAFCWRFWHITSNNLGKIGVVLPRSAIAAKGSEYFRKKLFLAAKSIDVTTLQNNKRWIFDIHPQYTITLTCFSKSGIDNQGIQIKGPFNSYEKYLVGATKNFLRFPSKEVLGWSDDGALPLLPSNFSAEVFAQIRKEPRLDLLKDTEWRARPDREMDASLQKHMMDFTSDKCPEGFWPVYKGASYDHWNPDKGEYYAWADPKIVMPWIFDKRLRAFKGARDSVHKEFSKDYILDKTTLAPLKPRIAFRLITNRTNSRTMVCALTPPNVFHANSSQVIMMTKGTSKDEAYLLGILSSIPLDWYARRFVEVNFNFFLFNPLPIPRPNPSNPLWIRVVELSGRLASQDDRFLVWANEVDVKCGILDQKDKEDKIYELDAVVAHLYGLTEKQLVHIFETFHEGWDGQPRLDNVLKYYHEWQKKV